MHKVKLTAWQNTGYCKTRIFACPLFREFCDLGGTNKGCEYSKSHAFLLYYLV